MGRPGGTRAQEGGLGLLSLGASQVSSGDVSLMAERAPSERQLPPYQCPPPARLSPSFVLIRVGLILCHQGMQGFPAVIREHLA